MQRTGWLIVALLAVSQTPPGVQQWYFSDTVLVLPRAKNGYSQPFPLQRWLL
jgi:hypothetical protein